MSHFNTISNDSPPSSCYRALNALTSVPDGPIPVAAFYGLTNNGFGHLSRRSRTAKPIIAAVNGLALGGGMEIVLNCDLVVASQDSKFGFVEVKNGLVAVQGGEHAPVNLFIGPPTLEAIHSDSETLQDLWTPGRPSMIVVFKAYFIS